MVNNQEKFQEIQEKIENYLTEELFSYRLLAYQEAFISEFCFSWKQRSSQEGKLTLVKRILKENQENNIEYTGFPPYCPTKLQNLLQEWLVIQLEVQFQTQIQQN